MANKEKKKRTKGGKIEKNEASCSLTKELEALKSANAVDQENEVLEENLGKLSSDHMALQAKHKELECSHEKLVDSYATLEIAHEVVLLLVKFMQPLSHTCTSSQVQIDLYCTNDCFSRASQSRIEHVLVESCDDLIAKENDELKREVEKLQRDLYVLKEKSKVQPSQDNHDDMVKKLEKGSNITSSTPQQHAKTHQNKIQEKSKVGHIKSLHCPTKHKMQEPLSKKSRSTNKWRLCY
jgi:hypothetical protein